VFTWYFGYITSSLLYLFSDRKVFIILLLAVLIGEYTKYSS